MRHHEGKQGGRSNDIEMDPDANARGAESSNPRTPPFVRPAQADPNLDPPNSKARCSLHRDFQGQAALQNTKQPMRSQNNRHIKEKLLETCQSQELEDKVGLANWTNGVRYQWTHML